MSGRAQRTIGECFALLAEVFCDGCGYNRKYGHAADCLGDPPPRPPSALELAEAKIARIRALHAPDRDRLCEGCEDPWPCSTDYALADEATK